jgi:general secretion pathway protein F
MQFKIRALAPDLVITQLTLDAFDEAQARRMVEARGLFVSSIAPAQRVWFPRLGGSATSALSLVLFSQELLALLQAGLSVVEALEALQEKEDGVARRSALDRLLSGLREGKRLSTVMADQPEIFTPLYVGIVRAAEGTSDLPRSLTRFIDYQQRIDTVRSKIVSAAIYPTILLLVGGGVSAFLIGYVVPRFAEVYQGAGRNLPWMSQLLLNWGQFAARNTLWLVTLIAGAVVVAVLLLRRLTQQGGVARLLARLPGIGERIRIYHLSRLYLTLGMLSEGGIPIVQAISTVMGMVSPAFVPGLKKAQTAIESGLTLSVAFEDNGLTTPISLRLLRVGERTGEMGSMLTQSAAFYDGEISRWIDRFTRTFEPLLMAAIGLIVGTIVMLLYMPIFDLAGDMT